MKKLIVIVILLTIPQMASASLFFNTSGTANYVNFGNAGGSTPGSGTVYAWIKETASATTGRIFVKQSGTSNTIGQWALNIPGTSTRIRCTIDYNTADADAQSVNSTISLNTWTFVACVHDGINPPKLYVGTSPSNLAEPAYVSAPVAGTGGRVSDGGGPVLVGSNGTGASANFPGYIYMVDWIPGTALTLGQLRNHMFCTTKDTSSQLFTVLINGTGTQPDWSGYKNTGTVSGTVLNVPNPPLPPPFSCGSTDTNNGDISYNPFNMDKMLALLDMLDPKTIIKRLKYL